MQLMLELCDTSSYNFLTSVVHSFLFVIFFYQNAKANKYRGAVSLFVEWRTNTMVIF